MIFISNSTLACSTFLSNVEHIAVSEEICSYALKQYLNDEVPLSDLMVCDMYVDSCLQFIMIKATCR